MKTINNATEYQQARAMIDAYQRAADEWMKVNKTNGIPFEVCATFPHADVEFYRRGAL